MVAHLLSLKWRLLLNGFRRSPWQIVGMAVGALYAAGVALSCAAGLVALRWADPQTAQTAVVLGGAVVMTGWMLVPLVASAADLTLDEHLQDRLVDAFAQSGPADGPRAALDGPWVHEIYHPTPAVPAP